MKRLAVALALLVSIGALAQKQQGHRTHNSPKMDMSAEQMATLQTKKMTLALDLTKAQQQKVMTINLNEAEFKKVKWEEMKALRESGEHKKPTPEERFELENARLDHQIAHQEKMKEVLNDEQYQTWKKIRFAKSASWQKENAGERKKRIVFFVDFLDAAPAMGAASFFSVPPFSNTFVLFLSCSFNLLGVVRKSTSIF